MQMQFHHRVWFIVWLVGCVSDDECYLALFIFVIVNEWNNVEMKRTENETIKTYVSG
jgi:hypothetical protein